MSSVQPTRCLGTSPFGRCWNFTCSVVERHLPNIAPLLRQAHLFCFPHRPQDVLTKSMPQEQCDFWKENFALPYPITAIEDRVGLLLMWDSEYLETDDWVDRLHQAVKQHSPVNLHPVMTPAVPNRGMFRRRFFMDVMPTWSILNGEAHVPKNRRAVILPTEDAVMLQFGVAEPISMGTTRFGVEGVPLGYWVVSKHGILFRDEPGLRISKADGSLVGIRLKDDGSTEVCGRYHKHAPSDMLKVPADVEVESLEVLRCSLINVKCFMEEVMWFNNPDRFVVEETTPEARGPRPPNLKGKIRRANERPIYHSWTPIDVRKLHERGATDSDGQPIKRRGHWRRGHFRTLRADRFVRSGMRGRTILVRPSFIGEPDFYVQRSHYRLLLGRHEILVGEQPTVGGDV